MKNPNNTFTVALVALAFAVTPAIQAEPRPDGGPTRLRVDDAASPNGGPVDPRTDPVPRSRPTPAPRPNTSPANRAAAEGGGADREASATGSERAEAEQMAVVTIHNTENVTRGKIGAFVLEMKPAFMFGGRYVNFKVGGTAVSGLDYVPLVSPAHIGESGFGVIQVATLPDKRGSSIRQAYSVVITLEDGPGYSVGEPSSATIWIKP